MSGVRGADYLGGRGSVDPDRDQQGSEGEEYGYSTEVMGDRGMLSILGVKRGRGRERERERV